MIPRYSRPEMAALWRGGFNRSLKRIPRVTASLIFLTVAAGQAQQKLPPTTEFVLSSGMAITATNLNGTVTISAGHGTERRFSGKGWSKRRNLIPRDTRWYGSLGLYDPAASASPYGRLLADEGQLFFKSESEALRYLDAEGDYFKPVFNNRGLVVGYHVENMPGGEPTRSVQVWQIYINGKRPISLPGADDTAVTIKGGVIPDTAAPHPAPVGLEMSLSDKEYTPEKTKNESTNADRPAGQLDPKAK